MARGRPAGALGRAMSDLTVGTLRAQRARALRDRQMGAAELDLQYQIDITGVGGLAPGFTTIQVDFDYEIYYAPGQRDSTLETPHFTHGAVVVGSVMVTAHVQSWTTDEDNGAFIGALVMIGVIGSGSYTGTVHLNFQGYGSLREDDSSGTP